ncbi:phosphoglycerate mutase-like protein [Mycena galopus ATCC 62051]|nr:phosphoglycerate mutase-like protein [Mycena galopus ATCC 62051]
MFSYEASSRTVTGFFAQDDPLVIHGAIGAVPPRFGLLDSSDARWPNLTGKLREMNSVDASVVYKLIFFGRHGQGYHNVAVDKYGTELWDDKIAMEYGDEELTWGPDPELTALGKAQAVEANRMWKAERALAPGMEIPLPERLYCSPLTRALQTQVITFDGVSDARAVVLENCREEFGQHTCDKRNTRTYIQTAFPQFEIKPSPIEEGAFTEEDMLWTETTREMAAEAAARVRQVLDHIFANDKDTSFVSITAHSGTINAFLRVLGRPRYPLPTGGTYPVL